MIVVVLIASVFFAVLPMVFFLGVVWWLDRYDREPVWLVFLTFLWGAVGAVSLALIGNTTIINAIGALFGGYTAEMLGPPIVAPLVEEPVKAMVLFAVVRSRYFDNTTDGFVYGAATGLGFGMTENLLYFTQVGAGGDLVAYAMTVVIRTFFSAVMHATASSCVGAGLGFSRFSNVAVKAIAIPAGFAAAMGIHANWNGLLTAGDALGWGSQGMFAAMGSFAIIFVGVFGLFQLCLLAERRMIKRELLAEAREGLLPERHVDIIASWIRRSTGPWAGIGVNHRLYIKAACTLAHRRAQARASKGEQKKFYDSDVERLRLEVRGLLEQRRA